MDNYVQLYPELIITYSEYLHTARSKQLQNDSKISMND